MSDSTTMMILLLSGIAAAAAAVFLFARHIRSRRDEDRISADDMEGHDFEYYCADLLRSAGFQDVEVTQGSGDFGADILAEKDGVSYAVQCKCYEDAVGVHAVQEAYAGKAFYDRMVGAVMTNRYFTGPAVTCAEKLHILLWDRGYIQEMLDENTAAEK